MKIEKFEDIMAWQKAKDLTLKIYQLFHNCKDGSFKNQIQRAALSICNNIAEGYERKTNKELIYFLYIAKGSSGEVRSMLSIAIHLGYINQTDMKNLVNQATEISKMLHGFINKITKS